MMPKNIELIKEVTDEIESALKDPKGLVSHQRSPIENIGKIDAFLDLAFKIEKERNDIAYGKKVTEGALKEKISIFLDFKKEVENA